MTAQEIFWLHIKKSAGQATRAMLSPYYREVDRSKRPACFIQSERRDWNDILNNYRVPLGELQFKRCLFARTHLWKDDYASLFKFAFVRNPMDRCLSQFFYLWHPKAEKWRGSRLRGLPLLGGILPPSKPQPSLSDEFDHFLEAIEACRASDSNHTPFGLHFQTHTADMWTDITDLDGNVLLDKVWRLEALAEGINHVRNLFGAPPLAKHEIERKNSSPRTDFAITSGQRSKIEKLFAGDFDLYERS